MNDYTPSTATTDDVFSWLSSITSEEEVRAVHRWLAEHDRQIAERAWDKGARHVYKDGGKCFFARDGDPCPYNPYRKEASDD